jgi:hypothetical protein
MLQPLQLDLDLGLRNPVTIPAIPTFRDSAFEDNKTSQIHRWVPWIAGFSANFVQDIFEHYLPPSREAVVLEPFAGVGTTLVEGILAGYAVVGFEINPYAFLASKVKCEAYKLDVSTLDDEITSFLSNAGAKSRAIDQALAAGDVPSRVMRPPVSTPPPGFKSRVPFLSDIVELRVLHCLDCITSITDDDIRELFMLAFGAILVGVSNYSYEPSLGSRVAAGRLPVDDDDVVGKLVSKLRGMRDDIAAYKRSVAALPRQPHVDLYHSSSLTLDDHLNPQSVDLVVTSPPYLNNYHYIRNTRPHLFWLDFVASSVDLKVIERNSFGQFWQTVRDEPAMRLAFDYPDLTQLLSIIEKKNTEKGVYGGQGWANYAVQYFNDSFRICRQLQYVLKSGGHAVFVLGNSVIQGVDVKTDQVFADIAKIAGLEVEDIHVLRTKRVGNSVITSSIRNGHSVGATLYETAVVLRRK